MKFTLAQKRAMRADPLGFARSLPIAQLNAVLKELDDRYREGNEVLTDEQYDIMDDYRWSKSKKKKTAASVGGVKNADVKLEVAMASLDKFRTMSPARQQAFMKATSFTLSDKEDGISLSITYDGGVPILATTRGKEGTVGKDVSKSIPYLRIPKKIPFKGRFIVRAEFTADKAVFIKHFAADFKTSRNMAGGLLNRNEAHVNMKKFRVVCYEILKGITAGQALNTQLEKLAQYGFDVVPYMVVNKITPEGMEKYHDLRKKDAGRDIDGVVMTQNVPYKVTAGYPTHAYAFKINSLENAHTLSVKDVVWEETRYGKWFPRIMIEPTIIGGVEVSWFTGHNAFYIEHGYLKPKKGEKAPYAARPINKGTVIKAVRSGDVIPYIMEVVKGAKKPSMPPGPYERETDGVHFRVVHEEKSNIRTIKELTYFFTVLDVDGVKQGVITKLVDAGYDTVKKIMKMTMQDLQTLPRSADTSASKLHKALREARSRMTFQNVAQGSAAFGEGIGEKRLQALVDDIPDLLDFNWTVDELATRIEKVKGFKKLAHQIAENFSDFIKFCKRNGIKLTQAEKAEVTGSKMAGQAVLFTSVRDDALQQWIIANGGKIASTVKQATMLLVKDVNASNKKTDEAKSIGTPILTLANFRKKHGI